MHIKKSIVLLKTILFKKYVVVLQNKFKNGQKPYLKI